MINSNTSDRRLLRIKAENGREIYSTEIEAIYEKIKSANIIDKAIRQEHTSKINSKTLT